MAARAHASARTAYCRAGFAVKPAWPGPVARAPAPASDAPVGQGAGGALISARIVISATISSSTCINGPMLGGLMP